MRVQGELAAPSLQILTVFTSLACYSGTLPTAAVKTAAVPGLPSFLVRLTGGT